jgi:hypothetical protein
MLWGEIMMMAALRNYGRLLRETPNFVAYSAPGGVRITAKDRRVMPRSRVISQGTWEQLARMRDKEFDGSCILDLGIGVFQRREASESPKRSIN